MKKISIIVVLLFLPLTGISQGWEKTYHPEDKLMGTQAYTSYYYTDALGNGFVYWSDSDVKFRVITTEGIFDYSITSEGQHIIHCKVGFYNDEDVLVEDKNMILRVVNGNASQAEMFNPIGNFGVNKRKGKELLKYINEEQGYVRVVATLYGGGLFDIKIPCMN